MIPVRRATRSIEPQADGTHEARGDLAFGADRLSLRVTAGGERSTPGIDVLKILAFDLAAEAEAADEAPPFQYIVTTTTDPPQRLRGEPWLRLTLAGGPAAERLLRRDL